jgi:hypothetical protein
VHAFSVGSDPCFIRLSGLTPNLENGARGIGPTSAKCEVIFARALSTANAQGRAARRPQRGVIMKLDKQDETFERILESAVVLNWTDLMHGQNGSIHIEYGFAPSSTLDHLQVWTSIKSGYWLLACTYRMSASQSDNSGVHFDNGYESKGLAHNLGAVMQHQNLFALPRNLGRRGLLQVVTPTEKETKEAAACMSHALDRVNSLADPAERSKSPAARNLVPGSVMTH